MNLGFGGLMSNQHILMTSKCALELRVKCHNLDFKKQNKKQYINPVNPPPHDKEEILPRCSKVIYFVTTSSIQ